MRRHTLVAGAVALAFAWGCAGSPPRARVAAAESALRDAETAQAQTLATPEWNSARDTLERAQKAMERERYADARELADQALVEAQLASARAKSESARKSNEALEGAIQDLRKETERSGERLLPDAQ